MSLFKFSHRFPIFQRITRDSVIRLIDLVFFLASLCTVGFMIYEFGYSVGMKDFKYVAQGYHVILRIFLYGGLIKIILNPRAIGKEKGFWFEIVLLILLMLVQITWNPGHFPSGGWLHKMNHVLLHILLFIYSVIQISKVAVSTMQRHLKPELTFIYSFLAIIVCGSFLLMLPNAHYGNLKFIDALFTAVSAVCVTGLTVVDIAGTFTITGQVILLLLIQIGGVGVMTFTSFLAMSFFTQTSFNDQMALKNILSEESMNNIFRTLFYTFFTTVTVEAIGTYLLWWQVRDLSPELFPHKVFFAVFHSVSAYCNAGFSTLPGNLNDMAVRDLYGFQGWIALLVIIGGIGFPIVFNYGKLFNHKIRNLFYRLTGSAKRMPSHVRIVTTTTRIVITMTLILLISGTFLFWIFENSHVLKGMEPMEKLTVSFFNAVTPRTAGFNNVEMSALTPSTISLLLLFMWIGASPLSSGGGIKTTTFMVGLMSMWQTLRGKNQVEIFKRQLPATNVSRACAIIFLSVLWISGATILLSFVVPESTFVQVFFEVMSAISTVGLTLDFTPMLNDWGKLIISVTMFVGRVGLITLLSGVLHQQNTQNYVYADENVIL